MIRSFCVLGGTGAIGSAIVQKLLPVGKITILNTQNCNLYDVGFSVPDVQCDVLVNASGTFGGLKQYEERKDVSSLLYVKNLELLVKHLAPKNIINISSAAVINPKNHAPESTYYEYVKTKMAIESIFFSMTTKNFVNLRCTNIVSQYENFKKSGHSIASIFRKFWNSDGDVVHIWSNKNDWREYIDANDVAELIRQIIISENYIGNIKIGSGIKIYILEIVNFFKEKFNYKGDIQYTQPHKNGPLSELIGFPILGTEFIQSPTPSHVFLKNCFNKWIKS